MSKRIIISEQEKNDIKKMYNINEGIYDEALEYLKDKGEDILDFFSDILDIKDDSDEEDEELGVTDIEKIVSDDELSSDEIKKLEKKLEDAEYTVSEDFVEENRMLPLDLFKLVNSKIKNELISFALVANAYGESNFNCSATGDSGDYAQKRKESIRIGKKKYCSFGLWQFNICGGLGVKYLKAYSYENKTPKEKLELLSDCNKQIEYMCSHIKEKIKNIKTEKSVLEWVEWIVREVERPSDMVKATKKRQEWARKNIDNTEFNLSDETIENLA
jgi:hypothetical protein